MIHSIQREHLLSDRFLLLLTDKHLNHHKHHRCANSKSQDYPIKSHRKLYIRLKNLESKRRQLRSNGYDSLKEQIGLITKVRDIINVVARDLIQLNLLLDSEGQQHR